MLNDVSSTVQQAVTGEVTDGIYVYTCVEEHCADITCRVGPSGRGKSPCKHCSAYENG